MKTVLVTLMLVLAFQLAAEMEFTQKNTISIPNGVYSFAELRYVQGEEQIVVYSKDTNNFYLTFCDKDGNILETMSLAMPYDTIYSRMSYFEWDDIPYVVVNSVARTDSVVNNNSCQIHSYSTFSLYNLQSGECTVSDTVRSYLTDYSWESSMGYQDYHIYNVRTNQPIATYGPGYNGILLSAPYNLTEVIYNAQYGNIFEYTTNYSFYCRKTVISPDEITHNCIEQYGHTEIEGHIADNPRISSSYTQTLNFQDPYMTDIFIYWNGQANFMAENMGETSLHPFLLISDHYPAQPQSFTVWETQYNGEPQVSEFDLEGNRIWSQQDTSMPMTVAFENLSFRPVSCCFGAAQSVAYTVYFGITGDNYEVRNRINGHLMDSGEAPFSPDNIDRMADETLVFLAPIYQGVEVWHGNYPVSVDDPTESPELELTVGNYPNPFNPTTTISYSLPSNGMAEVSVFNTRGQRVKTLVNEKMEAGDHEVVWHGDDENGMAVSSGIYLYRVQANDRIVTGKMLMLK